jgi:hypothetical protein
MKRCSPVACACLAAFLAVALTGCGERQEVPSAPQIVGRQGILHRGVETVVGEPAVLSPTEAARKQTAERMDTEKLLGSAKIVTDQDPKMLVPPAHLARFAGQAFTLAATAPAVEFGIVPAKPLFFAEPPAGNTVGPWSNWSQANHYPPTGKFYSSVGDHASYDAHIYIVEYDPAARSVKVLPEVNQVLGRGKNVFSEGKIHGWLDFYGGPELWYCTYWAKYPEPTEEDYQTGYDGGHIMSLNVMTGDIVDYGVPLVRASWPYHRVDTKRGMMYAVGMFGEFLAWDMTKQQTRWAGYLPEGLGWWVRAILIDEETGMVYTTNQHESDKAVKHVIRYDPFRNRFAKLACEMPKNEATGTVDAMRAQTRDRGPDGLFYAVTSSGQLFTFDPVKEAVVDRGLNWPGEQRYTTSMDRSPGGRYVYYLPGAHGLGYLDGSPVVQFDTHTGAKKVLAFLAPFYFEKYGYTLGGTFSIKLDATGESLFVLWNGGFADPEEQLKRDRPDVFGNCAVMLIRIPESERRE